MKVYVVFSSFIYNMCETFYQAESIYKDKDTAMKEVERLKNNGDDEAYLEEMEIIE